MGAKELFQAGKLDDAVRALGAEVRDNPTDVRRRTFLFELLCFQGAWDRAEKHLSVLADATPDARMGAVLYLSSLHAERVRHETFSKKDFPHVPAIANSRGGSLNDQAFEEIEDADPRVGARLEVFAAGAYLWIPFAHIESIETEAPKRLRDLLWIPALVRTGPAFKGTELGEVLMPVLAPFSASRPDDAIRLGRATEFDVVDNDVDGLSVPFGQRVFNIVVNGEVEEVPILDIRKIEFTPAAENESSDNVGAETQVGEPEADREAQWQLPVMPKPESDLTVTPSLIDRLIDANPGSQVEAPSTRSQSVRDIKKSLRRDMEWLLNTRRNPEAGKAESMEELRESLYRYGLPDFSSHSIHSPRDRAQLLTELERAIALFEPRLTRVRLTEMEDPEGPLRVLHFQIEGLLDMDPVPERVSFDTTLQLTSGEYLIRGERGA